MLMPPSPYSSSDYWQLIRDGNPTHVKLEFSNSGGTLTDSDISSTGGLTVTSIVNPEPNMKYGTVSSTEVRVVLIDNPNLANISWENEFELSMGVEDNGNTVWVSLGNFKGKAPEKSAYTTTPSDIVFTAYDTIRNLANIPADDLISLVTFPTTFKNMCDTIFAGAGYTIQFVDNYNQTVEKNPFPAGLNLRQVAEKIAEATYCFVKADPLGYTDLLFTPYANKTRHHLTVDDYYDVNISNIIPIVPGTYKWTNTDKPSLSLTYQYPNGTSLSEIYEVIDNNIVSSIAYADRQSFMDTIVYGHIFPIYLVLTPSTPDIIQYRIASVNCVGNWLIEAGDAVKVDYPNNNVDMLVFSRTLFWNGSCVDTYECTGSTSRSDDIMADSSSTLAEKLSYKADYDKVVHTDGSEQTIDGHKTFTYCPEIANDVSDPHLYFSSSQNIGSWNGRLIFNDARVNGHVGNGYFSFIAYSPDNNGHMTNYYEEFCFPSVDTGRSTNATYKIITTKDGLANNLTTTTEGYALDARQGKTLKDSIPTKVSQLTNDSGYTTNTGTVTSVATGAGLTGGTITGSGTISINGMNTSSGSTSKCLTEKGTWASFTNNAGTVTSVATGAGLTGGTITSSGTISINGMNTSTGDTTKCLTQKGTWASFTNNAGTVTSVKMNGTAYNPSSGVVDLGTVVTDVSGKANDNAVVHLAGTETITGVKLFQGAPRIRSSTTSPPLYFQGQDLESINGIIYLVNSETSEQKYGRCYFQFRQYSPASDGTRTSYYEDFRLPAVDIGRNSTTGNDTYNILTSKSAVTVPQGGTGATTAANARANLGAVNIAGDTMSGNLIVQKASGDVISAVKNSTSGLSAYIMVASAGKNHGLYSNGYVDNDGTYHSNGNWIVYRDAANVIRVNGRATENVLKTGDTMTGDLTATNFKSTNYNLETIGSKVNGIIRTIRKTSSSRKATFTLEDGHHAMVCIASGFATFFRSGSTLYNTTLPSGFTAALSSSTVTITRSSDTTFQIDGLVI